MTKDRLSKNKMLLGVRSKLVYDVLGIIFRENYLIFNDYH
jgi:hypothetical protein